MRCNWWSVTGSHKALKNYIRHTWGVRRPRHRCRLTPLTLKPTFQNQIFCINESNLWCQNFPLMVYQAQKNFTLKATGNKRETFFRKSFAYSFCPHTRLSLHKTKTFLPPIKLFQDPAQDNQEVGRNKAGKVHFERALIIQLKTSKDFYSKGQ